MSEAQGGLENRKQIFPDKVDVRLIERRRSGEYQHSVTVGENEDILSGIAIGTEGIVAAYPHLLAVALHPLVVVLG